jgi:tripartite-type tricarboxylate transporter receptor subunit TctC
MSVLSTFIRRACAAALCLGAAAALAQSYPNRNIEWVVPYPPGGGTDVVARSLAQAMTPFLGGKSPVIINKPGAATNIGAEYVAHAKPDGYAILSADTATLAANPFIYTRLSYSAEKDFAPIGLTVRFPMILVVNPQVPAKNLKELQAWAKAQANPVNYATPGAGSPHHLAAELFREMAGLPMSHVPYRGAAPAVQDVVAGQVPMMFVDTASGYQFIASGKLRALGIASPRRVKNFDAIPTLAEQGLKGFEAYAWQGLVAPAGTPAEVIATLNKALLAALDTTEIKARLQVLGLEAIPGSPAQMADYAAAERAKWGQVIKASGIKAD